MCLNTRGDRYTFRIVRLILLAIMYETQIDKIVELAVNLNICCNVFECALNFPWERQRYISMCT